MEPEIRIKEHAKEADALALKWQEFVQKYPETSSFETEEEFYIWAKKHPEINPDTLQEVLDGKNIQDTYNLLRDEGVHRQMDTQQRVDRSVIRADLPHSSILESAYLNDYPKVMEDDKDYQKITERLKKKWLESNPGKDFTSKEGIDYLYGSLEDKNAHTLRKDAERIFREDPMYYKRIERYDKEKKLIYKNPHEDPIVANLRKTAKEHASARQKHLGAPADIGRAIQSLSLEKLIKEYPEKAGVYTKKGGNIIAPYETREKRKEKKTLLERAQDIYNMYKKSENALRISRATGRFAEKSALGIGRTSGRIAIQSGRATITGIRTSLQGLMLVGRGVVAGAAAIGPIGWIVIGVIIIIIIIVFLIVLLVGAGGAGIGGSGMQTRVDCVDPNNPSSTIIVPDGNACAVNAAAFYSALEGIAITAVCRDKCTDFLGTVCDRDPATNTCAPPPASCGAPEAFCIEYTPVATSSGRLYDCNGIGGSGYASLPNYPSCAAPAAPTPTPTP